MLLRVHPRPTHNPSGFTHWNAVLGEWQEEVTTRRHRGHEGATCRRRRQASQAFTQLMQCDIAQCVESFLEPEDIFALHITSTHFVTTETTSLRAAVLGMRRFMDVMDVLQEETRARTLFDSGTKITFADDDEYIETFRRMVFIGVLPCDLTDDLNVYRRARQPWPEWPWRTGRGGGCISD